MGDVEIRDGIEIEVEEELALNSILTTEKEKEIIAYLQSEIGIVRDGENRKNYLDDVKRWRRQREARPEFRTKSIPWPGCSNVSIPMTMQETNAIYAMMKANFAGRKPMWNVEQQGGDKETAKVLQELLNLFSENKNYTNLREVNNNLFYDLVSLGTQFVHTSWAYETWRFKKRDSGGNLVDVEKVTKNAPEVKPVRLEDFYCRTEWEDIQKAPWVAERIYLYDYELKKREKDGIYSNIEAVLGQDYIEWDENKDDEVRRMGGELRQDSHQKDLYQVYLYYDIDDDGLAEDIIIWFDYRSGTVLRSQYNTLGKRPYVKFTYINRPNELYGIGVGWIVQHLQDEMDALHNMRNDGTQLSMLQMYITKRGSGIGPNEQFMPLKNIQVDDPAHDFVPIKFPDIGSGTIQAELLTKEYGDRATGASDAMMGFESKTAGTRATASGTMFLASQGSKIFTSIMANTVEDYNTLGELIIFHILENKDYLEQYYPLLSGEVRDKALNLVQGLEIETIPTTFQFKIQTTDVEKSEEARRQSIMTLIQLYTMYSERILQLYPLVYSEQVQVSPEIRQAGTKLILGATRLMEQVFDFFGEKDTEDYLPYVKDIEIMIEAIDALKDDRVNQIRREGNGKMADRGIQGAEGIQGMGGA